MNIKKTEQCCIWEWNPRFLFHLHQGIVKEYGDVTKMAQGATMGGLWEDFIVIFWITKYLQSQSTFGIKCQNI